MFDEHHSHTKGDIMENKGIKITDISINGYKAIRQLKIEANGNSVELTGSNGKGKSSVLEAIWVALTGKDVPDPVVNRDHGIKAEIILGLDDGHQVEWSYGKSAAKLRVFRPDGEPVKAERTYLNELIGKISFDPFDFIKRPAAEQKKILMDLLGLDLSDLDAKKRIALDNKKSAETAMLTAEQNLDRLKDAVETAPVDTAALMEQKTQRDSAVAQAGRYRDGIAQINRDIVGHEKTIADIDQQIADLKSKREQAKYALDSSLERLANGTAMLDEAEASIEKMPDVTEQLARSSEINAAAERWARRQELVAQHHTASARLEAAKEEAEAVDAERVARIAATEFPVEGLSFSEDGVLYNGLPFNEKSQCTSTIIKVGCAIAVSQNPTLKICRIQDGSLLDEDSKKSLLGVLHSYGFQCFIETVGKGELQALVIEEEG